MKSEQRSGLSNSLSASRHSLSWSIHICHLRFSLIRRRGVLYCILPNLGAANNLKVPLVDLLFLRKAYRARRALRISDVGFCALVEQFDVTGRICTEPRGVG